MRALGVALVLLPLVAQAQPVPTGMDVAPADKLAMEQQIMQLTGEVLQWRIQAIERQREAEAATARVNALQARVDEMEKKLAGKQ